MVSRYRSVAAAITAIFIATGLLRRDPIRGARVGAGIGRTRLGAAPRPRPSAIGRRPGLLGRRGQPADVRRSADRGAAPASRPGLRGADRRQDQCHGGQFQELYDKAILDMSTGTNSFDAFVFNPQWLGDFTGPGYLEDLTARVTSDPVVDWQDIGPFFRDFNATYAGKVYTIPLDGDFHMVYYRAT